MALVARLSCGIYGGPHKEAIDKEFGTLVNEVFHGACLPIKLPLQILIYLMPHQVLFEEIPGLGLTDAGEAITRGHFFDKVMIPLLG